MCLCIQCKQNMCNSSKEWAIHLCLNCYSGNLGSNRHRPNWCCVRGSVFLVCHHVSCALVSCQSQCIPQTVANMPTEACFAYQGIYGALFCPTLSSSNFWKICSSAVFTGFRVVKLNDQAMCANLPVLPMASLFKAMKERHSAAKSRQLVLCNGRKPLVLQSTAV